jgi:hypothetical protein
MIGELIARLSRRAIKPVRMKTRSSMRKERQVMLIAGLGGLFTMKGVKPRLYPFDDVSDIGAQVGIQSLKGGGPVLRFF